MSVTSTLVISFHCDICHNGSEELRREITLGNHLGMVEWSPPHWSILEDDHLEHNVCPNCTRAIHLMKPAQNQPESTAEIHAKKMLAADHHPAFGRPK
jgi:hypothetical protein